MQPNTSSLFHRIVSLTRRHFALTIAALVVANSPALLHAQDAYPSKPIVIIVPMPAGGANDAIARLLGQKMSESMGQPIVIDNRPGAGGTIGSAIVVKAPADGYTLLMGGFATHAGGPHLYPTSGYDALKDFAPIGLIGVAPILATVAKDSPYANLKALVDDAKAKPDQSTYGSSGNGSPLHLAAALFNEAAGIKLLHVPYKGGNAHTTDLIGGRIAVIFDTSTSAMPLIRGGRIRAVAVSGKNRLADLPDVPTFAELGYPKYEVGGWYALYAPAKTPAPIIAKLNTELNKAIANPEAQQKLQGFAIRPAPGTVQQLADFTKSENDKYGKLIKALNIQGE